MCFLCVLLFMQEEKIEPVTSNTTFNSDSSWKIPTGSSILMRASQLSSEFERGDQSYLRLSLGQFFEQRSEALGCLGSADNIDAVKRVSKNYHWNRNKKCCLLTDIGILELIQIEGRKKIWYWYIVRYLNLKLWFLKTIVTVNGHVTTLHFYSFVDFCWAQAMKYIRFLLIILASR